MRKIHVAPSILSANMEDIEREVEKVEDAGAVLAEKREDAKTHPLFFSNPFAGAFAAARRLYSVAPR